MPTAVDPHSTDEPGYIVAWRSKKEFKAGKYPDEVMTYGEARAKAEKLSAENTELTYWAEHEPFEYKPH